MSYIYKISNDINDKVYIGKTIYTPEKRLSGHLCTAFYPNMKNNKFATAIRELGKEHFKIETLEKCDDEIAGERERYWIECYNSINDGYNSSHGGERSLIVDRELVVQYYEDLKSQKFVAEELGISSRTVERILNKENITKQTPIERAKNHGLVKSIAAYTKTGEFVKKFDSIMDGCRWLVNTNQVKTNNPRSLSSQLSRCANGQRKTAQGYQWRFI